MSIEVYSDDLVGSKVAQSVPATLKHETAHPPPQLSFRRALFMRLLPGGAGR